MIVLTQDKNNVGDVESCLDKGSLCSCNRDLNISNNAGNKIELIKHFYNQVETLPPMRVDTYIPPE